MANFLIFHLIGSLSDKKSVTKYTAAASLSFLSFSVGVILSFIIYRTKCPCLGAKRRRSGIIVLHSKKMGRKKKRQLADWEESFPRLRDETWHGIAALACFALTLFFFLAAAGYAGAAGRLAFETLSALFGLGYYALPIVLVILGLSFSRLIKPNFVTVRLLAGLVAFLALLGLVVIIGSETGLGGGGWLGQLIAAPLLAWLNIFGVVFLLALLLVAFLILFDTHLKPIWFTPWRWRQTAADENAPTFSPPPAPAQASGGRAGDLTAELAAGGGPAGKTPAGQIFFNPGDLGGGGLH